MQVSVAAPQLPEDQPITSQAFTNHCYCCSCIHVLPLLLLLLLSPFSPAQQVPPLKGLQGSLYLAEQADCLWWGRLGWSGP
jgi:hypothetical protein